MAQRGDGRNFGHAIVIRRSMAAQAIYMRGADMAISQVWPRRRKSSLQGREAYADWASVGRWKAAGQRCPPFQNESIGNQPYPLDGYMQTTLHLAVDCCIHWGGPQWTARWTPPLHGLCLGQ